MSNSSPPRKKLHIEQPDTDKEKAMFMEKLLRLDYQTIMYTMENMLNSPLERRYRAPTESDLRRYQCFIPQNLDAPLVGIDLGDVKHYQHSELIPYVARRIIGTEISENRHVSMFPGVVNYSGQKRKVLIKTWKLNFPPTSAHRFYQPARLYNEIQLLMQEPMKSHPHVPKLIGYSIDKMLAVVYDFGAKCALKKIINGVDLVTRLSMAARIGRILQSFHDEGIIIGCIESHSIMLDEEDKIYFCDLGLRESVHDGLGELSVNVHGGYAYHAPEIESPYTKMTREMDIYAYGILVLELIEGKVHNCGHPPRYDPSSVVGIDMHICELVKRCVSHNPMERPRIGDVAKALEKIIRNFRDHVIGLNQIRSGQNP